MTVTCEGVGFPSTRPGEYLHCVTESTAACRRSIGPLSAFAANNLSILINACGNRDGSLDVRLPRGCRIYEPSRRNQFRIAGGLGCDNRCRGRRRRRRRWRIGCSSGGHQQPVGGGSPNSFRRSNIGHGRGSLTQIGVILIRRARGTHLQIRNRRTARRRGARLLRDNGVFCLRPDIPWRCRASSQFRCS